MTRPLDSAVAAASSAPGILSTDGRYAWNDILPDCTARPCTEPANAGIAVSPAAIVDWTDQGFSFHDRDGAYQGTVDRAAFFGETLDGGRGGSVSVVWDRLHSRWIAVEAADDCSTGRLFLAVSTSTDPTGTWRVWTRTYPGGRPLRPTIGVTNDKILVASDHGQLVDCEVVGQGGGRILVADTLTAYATPASLPTTTLDLGLGTIMAVRPAVSQSSTNTAFLVDMHQANNDFTINVGYLTVDGTVAAGNVSITNSVDLTTAGVPPVLVPEAAIPWSDGAATAAAPNQAVWASGRLWLVLTRSCAIGACVKAIELDTTNKAAPTVSQQIDIADVGAPVFAPGIAVAGNGQVWVAYSRAYGSIEPYAAYRNGGDPSGTIRPGARLLPGDPMTTGLTWGPGSGIAPDPADPDAVWQHGVASQSSGGWLSWRSRLQGGKTAAPAGTVLLNEGASSTVYMRVLLELAATGSSGVTEVRVSNKSSMTEALELPLSSWSWHLDDLAADGDKTTGNRAVFVQFGDGAGHWSPVTWDFIALSPSVPLTRLWGADRYATAAAISSATYRPGVPYVFIASGLNFPDALAGASAAGWNESPILFVGTTLPAATITELQRLQPERIVILGGTSVVSSAIATSLKAYATTHTVVRLAGPDRYATAAAISAWAYPDGAPFAFIAYGGNFPDALAAGPVAGWYGAPILFVNTTSIPSATSVELLRLQPEFVVIVGGTSVVGTAVESKLEDLIGPGNVGRLAGYDRYATAAAIVNWGYLPGIDGAFIASGLNFPDALSGAAAAATTGNPILFVGGSVPPTTAGMLSYMAPKQYWVLGGTSVVSTSVANQLLPYLGP